MLCLMLTNCGFVGELGCATKMKLVLNYVMGTTLAGLAEGMALAEKIGLNTAEMLNILSHTNVSSPFLRTKGTGQNIKGAFYPVYSQRSIFMLQVNIMALPTSYQCIGL